MYMHVMDSVCQYYAGYNGTFSIAEMLFVVNYSVGVMESYKPHLGSLLDTLYHRNLLLASTYNVILCVQLLILHVHVHIIMCMSRPIKVFWGPFMYMYVYL